MLDLHTGEIVITDLMVKGHPNFNTVEGSHKTVSALCREIADFPTTRPNMWDLASFHLQARNASYINKRDPGVITIGLDADCTIDVRNAEEVLAHLI